MKWIELARLSVEYVWLVLQSNFVTSLVGALAGAFFGALAAQKTAQRSKLRDEILEEIRSTSAAASMLYSIANTHIGLKKQHVIPLQTKYYIQRNEIELYLERSKAGIAQKQFEFQADMETMEPLYAPLEQIERLIFEQISVGMEVTTFIPTLVNCKKSLDESVLYRKNLIMELRSIEKNVFPYLYFGLEYQNVIDNRFKSSLDSIVSSTDDVIAFSIILGDALIEYALKKRKHYEEISHVQGPKIQKCDFSLQREYLYNPESYKSIIDEIKKQSLQK